MTARKPLSTMQRLKIFEAAGGRCSICGLKIIGREWDVEHQIPLALDGADDETNWAPAHRACHSPKTVDDVRRIAKARRQAAGHVGAKQSRNPMPGSKASMWRKRMDGRVERR